VFNSPSTHGLYLSARVAFDTDRGSNQWDLSLLRLAAWFSLVTRIASIQLFRRTTNSSSILRPMYPIGHNQVDLYEQCREHLAPFMCKDSHASQIFSVDAKLYQVLVRVFLRWFCGRLHDVITRLVRRRAG
jgi:hypothetical protein